MSRPPLTPPWTTAKCMGSWLSASPSCARTAHHVSKFMSCTRHYFRLQLGHSKWHAKDRLLVGRIVAYRFLVIKTETDLKHCWSCAARCELR